VVLVQVVVHAYLLNIKIISTFKLIVNNSKTVSDLLVVQQPHQTSDHLSQHYISVDVIIKLPLYWCTMKVKEVLIVQNQVIHSKKFLPECQHFRHNTFVNPCNFYFLNVHTVRVSMFKHLSIGILTFHDHRFLHRCLKSS
jgi:hypothetical protein